MARYIFITGGVVSSLGKGIASASLGALLQSLGYSVRLRKLDPYLNVDPGTMSPYQHGEVFVTDDGAETDLDIGHYERFTGVDALSSDSVSAGFIYWNVLQQERQGLYLGSTIQVIPHITDAIKDFIARDITDEDFVLCEIGGTVGDIESTPFLEAVRQFSQGKRSSVLFIHVTLLPYIAAAGEIKTKPTQHSVKELLRHGIQPDILLCRSELPISIRDKEKIALFCNVAPSCVIAAYTAKHIYDVPRAYHAEGLDVEVLRYFGLPMQEVDLRRWDTAVDRVLHPVHGTVCVKLVGKYIALPDAYKSVFEALTHAGIANMVSVRVDLVDSSVDDMALLDSQLADADAIIIPGGYGERGIEGKIYAIAYARTHGIPFLGICFGMQLAVIEFARHVLGIADATSSEFTSSGSSIVGLITEFTNRSGVQYRHQDSDFGGTQRLGAYDALLTLGTQAHGIYGADRISERHRHRYEIDISYADSFAKHGLIFSGISPDGQLPEILEYQKHPWFIGVQFHPELKSRPFAPHPLFVSLVVAALTHRNAILES